MRLTKASSAGLLAGVLLCGAPVHAQSVALNESASAMVKPQPTQITSNYNGSTSVTLTPVNPDGYAVAGIIFWRFNLASYAGWCTTNDGDLTVGQMWGEAGPHTFRVYAVQSNWNENAVTWSNYFGPGTTSAGSKAYTNWFGPELAVTGVIYVADSLTHWAIPAGEIQKWLRGTSPYFGLAIVPDDAGNNMFYTRLATWKPTQIPRLTLDVYAAPPPAVATNYFRVQNAVRMPNVPPVGLNLAGYAQYSSLTMHEIMPLGNFEPLLHGSLHFASSSQSTPSRWTAASGPSLSAADATGFQLEVLTGAAAGRAARITNLVGNTFYLDAPLLQPASDDAFAVRGVTSNYYRQYYVDTNVVPSRVVPPGSAGIMSALFQPNSALTYLMDNHTTPSYIVFTGTYVMSFWARSTAASQSLQILAARWNWGGTFLFNRSVPVTTNWVYYAFTNTIAADSPNGQNFYVTMKRTGGSGGIYVDDWSLRKILPLTQSVYTREAEDAITNVMTWCGRHWMGELGDTLDNFIAPRDGQKPTTDHLWGSGYYPTIPEFLNACETMKLGAAWFALPVVLSTNEGMNLIEFLAGPTNTPYGLLRAQRGHPAPWTDSLVIFLELGNEVWNYQNGPPYARMITQLFGAMRQSPWFNADTMPLVMGGQAGNDWRADNSVPQAKYYDCFDNAGYSMGNYSSTNTDDTFGPLLAFHDSQYNGSFGYQRDLLLNDGRGKRFTIYEMNMHTTSGTAPEGVRNAMVTSAGAAVAGFDALLTHYYESQMPAINVFAMLGSGFNYGGGVVKLWGIYASLEMGQLKRPYFHSMLGANRAIGRRAHLLDTATVGTPAVWLQPLKNGVAGTFPYLTCYAFAESNAYRVVLVNRDWWSNRVASIALPFSFSGTLPYTRFRPDSGSPWDTVESASFSGWVNGAAPLNGSNLTANLPPCSFTIFTITNAAAAMFTVHATRAGCGTYSRNPSGNYVAGTLLNTTAFPDDDAQFLGWSGDLTGMTQTAALTLNRDYSMTALFTPVPEPCGAGVLLLALVIAAASSRFSQ